MAKENNMNNKKYNKSTLRWIYSTSKKYHPHLIFLIVLNGVFSVISIVFALFCRGIIDSATEGNKEAVIHNGVGLFAVIASMLIIRLVCNNLNEIIHAGLEKEYKSRILSQLLKKSFKSTSVYHSGDLLNRMFSDVSVISNGITELLPNLIGLITRLIAAAAVLMTLDLQFTLLFIIAGLIVFSVSRFLRSKIKQLHNAVQETQGKVRSFLQETLEGIMVIKIFGAEEKMCRLNDENQQTHYKARMKRKNISIIANSGFGFIFQTGYLYSIIWGAFGIVNGTMSYGTLTAILQLVNQIQQPFASLSGLLPRFFGMTASAERIIELEALPDEAVSDKKADYNSLNKICIKNLSFSYGENNVLSNVNIDIEKNKFTSLTGISGGGKSTLFYLLLGIFEPQEGTIDFESKNGSFKPGTQTRNLFAYVPQGNMLFSGTVKENITFLNESASEEEIINAAKTACAYDFIMDLPDKMETKIGENGFGISEGQAQRIAVARAVLSGAPILLLDEATSALDEKTEALLLSNLSRLTDKTVLIVTHRRAALDICPKHLILKDGEITYGNL